MSVKNYKELIVWQKAMDLVDEVYRLVKQLPMEERFALADQLRRAAVSIPSNIAEGQGRNTTKDFVNFLSMARGSSFETETQLLICQRQSCLTPSQISAALNLCEEVGRMLNALIGKLSTTH